MAYYLSLYNYFFLSQQLSLIITPGKKSLPPQYHMRKSAVSLSVWQLIRGRILKIVVSCCCNNCNWEGGKERCAAGRQAVFRDSWNITRYTISPSVEIYDVISQQKWWMETILSSSLPISLAMWVNSKSLTTYMGILVNARDTGGDRAVSLG